MYQKLFSLINKFKIKPFDAVFLLILISSFFIRISNLNYNLAFNDEGVYIVVGKMGLFTGDWWSYGANLWMAGLPYIYPPLTALAYQIGGIMGSRFLNVIFGVLLIEEVYRFTRLINLFDEKVNQLAGLIAAFLVGFSAIGFYVSELATYDILSFFLLLFAINSFLKAKRYENGKYYFLTAITLLIAFLTKIIIAVYYPVVFLMSIIILKDRSRIHKKLAIVYFFIPFLIGISLYLILQSNNLLTYIFTHKDLGKAEGLNNIFELIWKITGFIFVISLPSFLILTRYKKQKELVSLIILSLVIPLFHIVLNREQTLNKHLYLTVIFLSVIASYGLSIMLLSANKLTGIITALTLTFIGFFYIVNSQRTLNELQMQWNNTKDLQVFLRQNVKTGDKILTENGGAVIL